MEEPKLLFHSFNVLRVAFEREATLKEGTFTVNFQEMNQIHIDDKNKKFRSFFVVSITHPEFSKFNLTVQAVGDFSIVGEVTEKIYQNFINISAPSIVYPYIRAFVSNLMSLSGMNPLHLPSVNFATVERKPIEQYPPSENLPSG